MKLKKIKTDTELKKYQQETYKHIDVLFPISYLKQGDVYGLYSSSGKIYGGFAFINQGPFRVLSSIPNFTEVKNDPSLLFTAEITGVWIDKGINAKTLSLRFWIFLLQKILTSPKRYFVYAYSIKKTNLEKIYSRANPEILFRGETLILEGMNESDFESVELIEKSQIVLQILKNLDFFTKRLRISQSLSLNHALKIFQHENLLFKLSPLYLFSRNNRK